MSYCWAVRKGKGMKDLEKFWVYTRAGAPSHLVLTTWVAIVIGNCMWCQVTTQVSLPNVTRLAHSHVIDASAKIQPLGWTSDVWLARDSRGTLESWYQTSEDAWRRQLEDELPKGGALLGQDRLTRSSRGCVTASSSARPVAPRLRLAASCLPHH